MPSSGEKGYQLTCFNCPQKWLQRSCNCIAFMVNMYCKLSSGCEKIQKNTVHANTRAYPCWLWARGVHPEPWMWVWMIICWDHALWLTDDQARMNSPSHPQTQGTSTQTIIHTHIHTYGHLRVFNSDMVFLVVFFFAEILLEGKHKVLLDMCMYMLRYLHLSVQCYLKRAALSTTLYEILSLTCLCLLVD